MSLFSWMAYDDVELFNNARLAALARALGINSIRLPSESVDWITDQFTSGGLGFGEGGFGYGPFGGEPATPIVYSDVTQAPWYDADAPASREFAGVLPLNVDGLDNSSLQATPTEYITNGGNGGLPRNTTQALVFSAVVVATTDRGAEFGRRWLDRTLKGSPSQSFLAGADLDYFRYLPPAEGGYVPFVHRREVSLSRGTSITRKRTNHCSSLWWLTWTMTDANGFEYGEEFPVVADLGAPGGVTTQNTGQGHTVPLIYTPCPSYNYDPLYDPIYPALVAPPTAPDFLPTGWGIALDQRFSRDWVRFDPIEPSDFQSVPMLRLRTTTTARMVRVSIFDSTSETYNQCNALFSAIITYLPGGVDFYLDGEREASYIYDGGERIRRADSLVYSPDAGPVEWTSFSDHDGMMLAVDTFEIGNTGTYQGLGTVRTRLDLIPKSD